ncbi:MAG: S1 RNA-binding domain-containing protein [Acidobacteria bacterium]|jgi:small subunit ribosomal protein S1|nr:S1 RNA-binding domain-containing protein [Acidobacteriota bacterium]MBV9184596.1 S1 RNA-binding domain-containing protein [Acidobacteriota bacterium]
MTQSRETAEATFAEAFEASLNFKTPEQGELLKGQIVSISGDDAFVSYGGPSEAVMAANELDGLDVGDTVEGTVVKTSPDIRISRKLAKGKASLDLLRQMYENRLPVEGKIAARNKGGFDVNIGGLRAFCPLSQIALGKIDNPDQFIGQSYEFRVTELSDDGRRIVVSRAALLKEANASKAEETRRNIVPGAELTGTIKTITPFGAFVDLGGIDGLLHVSEMSRRRVTDPNEVVAVGQEVRVKVIKVENDGKRISLSMKDQEPDPWSDVADRYPAGTQFSGRIVRTTDFGLFVEVEPGIDGLVHYSQLPFGVKQGDADIAIGTSVTGWIREVDASKKRLSLSLREVATRDPWDGAAQRYPAGKVVEGTVDHGGAPGIFVQIEPGLTGLIPNSEISVAPGADPSRAHEAGEKLAVRIMSIDPQRKRISLSHEAAKAAAERDEYVKFAEERGDNESGESAMALAFKRAMEKKK